MTYYIIGLVFGAACFVVGFFVGKRHGERLASAAIAISDVIKKA